MSNSTKGEQRFNARLTDEVVCAARGFFAEGWSLATLAAMYAVSASTLHKAIVGETWKHITTPPVPKGSRPNWWRQRAAARGVDPDVPIPYRLPP